MEAAAPATIAQWPARTPAPRGPLVVAQVKRALRSLIGQRGGTMLMRSWDSGMDVRIDCAVAGATADAAISCGDEREAAAVRGALDSILVECARLGFALARVDCSGPARSMLPAA